MIRPVVVSLLVCLPLNLAGLVRTCTAQDDGPLLPGLESGAAQEPTPAIEPESEPAIEPSPVPDILPGDDGIAPLDADGVPETGPRDEPQLVLPDPPKLEPEPAADQEQEPPRKKNLWQKSTDKIRTLTKPEPKAEVPAKEKGATPNWQLLRRTPPEASQPETGKSGQSERVRQQPSQLQQQQQLQRLQQQRLEQQRQLQRTMPEGPQSRWQSQEGPQQSNRVQPTPRSGTAAVRLAAGGKSREIQPPSTSRLEIKRLRPQQGQKQKRTIEPRSAASTPHAPWDMPPTATVKSGAAPRPAPLRSGSAASQATRAPQRRVVPR